VNGATSATVSDPLPPLLALLAAPPPAAALLELLELLPHPAAASASTSTAAIMAGTARWRDPAVDLRPNMALSSCCDRT
jgi:hypothetical protein